MQSMGKQLPQHSNNMIKQRFSLLIFIIITLGFIYIWYNWALIPQEYIRGVLKHFTEWQGAWNKTESVQEHLEALNLLISTLAFIGLLITIAYQHADLQATKKELKTTNREFTRQTLENSLFQYYQQMKSVEPVTGALISRDIFNQIRELDKLCKKMKRRPHLQRNRKHLRALQKAINTIRKNLKEYSTMRRIFASWCEWVYSQQALDDTPERQEQLVKEYIHRLWCMFNQDQRRILFLQNAFFLEGREAEWDLHYRLAMGTKCIQKFTRRYDMKSINLLLLTLHKDGNPPNYPLSIEEITDSIRDIYKHKLLPYTFCAAKKKAVSNNLKYYIMVRIENLKNKYLVGVITGSVITAAICLLF